MTIQTLKQNKKLFLALILQFSLKHGTYRLLTVTTMVFLVSLGREGVVIATVRFFVPPYILFMFSVMNLVLVRSTNSMISANGTPKLIL